VALPEPRRASPDRLGSAALVIALVVLLVSALMAAAAILRQPSTVHLGGPLPPVAPTSPAATSQPPGPSPEMMATFNLSNGWTKGDRLTFGVFWLDEPHPNCVVHSYTWKGKRHGAFWSDCESWEDDGYDILIFYVRFKNTSERVVTLSLRDLVLASRDRRTFGPVNVRSKAEFPTSFLPETLKLPPGDQWRGYVTFDGRVRRLVPDSMSYIDGKQTLRQEFEGTHGTEA